MDIEKARDAHFLYARMDELKSSILTMRSRYQNSGFGTTNLTLPTSWLPEIIAIAERELDKVNDAIEHL